MMEIVRRLFYCGAFLLVACALVAQSAELAEKSRQAHELMAAGKYEQAIPIYRDLMRALPSETGFILNLGLALHMAGHEKDAIAEFQKVLGRDAANFPAHLYLGYAYLSLGEAAKAIAPLRAALRADPSNGEARENLAKALLSLERYDAALEEFRSLAASNPGSSAAWYGLGHCYEALSQEGFSRLAPGSAYWLALAGEARARALQYSSAFYLDRQALRQMASLRGVHAALADIYRKTGRSDWATTEEEREGTLGAPNCATEKFACDYAAGRFQAIIAAADKSPEAFYWQSRAYNKLAVQAYARLGAFPNSVEYHELLATIHSSEMDYPGAAAEWRKAYELSQSAPEIEQQLAMALMQMRDFQEARPLLENLKQRQPQSASVNYLLGYLLLNQQEPGKAVPLLERAVQGDPKLLQAQAALGRAYLETGQSGKAVSHLRAAMPIDEDGSLHYQLGRAYQSSGQPRLAAQAIREYQRIHQAKEAGGQAEKEEIKILPP